MTMPKLLQKVKAIFSAQEITKPKPFKVFKLKKKLKKISPEKEMQTLEQLKQDIISNGYRSMKVSALFRLFNYQKRSSTNVDKVLGRLEKDGLFISKVALGKAKWDERIRIYKFPVVQSKDIFKDENTFETAFAENQWYKKLNLQINTDPQSPGQRSDRQFSPDGTKDRLDFRAIDNYGNNVVLELKNKGGEKRLIEQVLRYRTDLMHHFKTDKVNCIIITGERCLHTAKAFRALPSHEKKVITWYVYEWNKDLPDKIDFEEVTLDFINQHLAPIEESLKVNGLIYSPE